MLQFKLRVQAIHDKHKLPGMDMRRFKRTSGSSTALFANHLFYPPSSNPLSAIFVLVRGPDTTNRFIDAGMTPHSYTSDLVLYSHDIPFGQGEYRYAPFDKDPTLTKAAAIDLFNCFTSEMKKIYLRRVYTPGVDIVWGAQVKQAHKEAMAGLSRDWTLHPISLALHVPAVTTEYGTFPAGTAYLGAEICYSRVGDKIKFCKLIIYHCHPCASGAKANQGECMSLVNWQNNALIDSLVQLTVNDSRGITTQPEANKTFAYVAKPCPTPDTEVTFHTIDTWRAAEKVRPTPFLKSDLPTGVVSYIERHYKIDPNSPDSYLLQACQDKTRKGNETKRSTPSLDKPELSKMARAAEKRHEALQGPSREVPGLTGYAVKRARQEDTMIQTGSDHLRRAKAIENAYTNGAQAARTPNPDTSDPLYADFLKKVTASQAEKPGQLPQVARRSVVGTVRAALFGAKRVQNVEEKILGWPEGLPHNTLELNAEECAYVVMEMLRGTIKPKPDFADKKKKRM